LARERLDAAGINYWVRHDTSQDLFGLGRMGTGYNFVTGPVKVLVQRDDAQEASEIVGDLAVLKSQKLPTAVGIALLVLFILFPLVLMIYEKLK